MGDSVIFDFKQSFVVHSHISILSLLVLSQIMTTVSTCPVCFITSPFISSTTQSQHGNSFLQSHALLPIRSIPKRHRTPYASTNSSTPSSSQPNTDTTVHRSKMILTRRIFSWTLSRSRDLDLDNMINSRRQRKSLTNVTTYLPVNEPSISISSPTFSVSSALNPDNPVATFVFRRERGLVNFSTKRRAGDPPSRYLQLSYGFVIPYSPGASNGCSNPRVSGSLKKWYHAAARWNLLHADTDNRNVLMLEQKRRYIPTNEVEEKDPPKPEPIKGQTVPLLKEERWSRVLGHSPRVIVIGDIHGCIDELKELLRLADYQPGDQVILLGDLVAKGPDSVSVVKLAREIGARTVRGNHDYEVLRWWEARVRGDHEAMVSLEHSKIARALGAEDIAWLLESPWFIECEDMDHLFVHAGFIPNVKLTQQNPRLMMNMRSVLNDGTVTAKNVLHCEWARLWKGPQTVVFGHDAYRGLQVHQFAKGIDTGCVYGGRLTALLLPENRLISVAAKRAYISPKRFRVVNPENF